MKKEEYTSIEEAKRIISPNYDFDPIEWERKHILKLAKSVIEQTAQIIPCYYGNLRKTAERYLYNHRNTTNKKEYQILVDAYNKIPIKE